jgi:hypothetical protein
LEQLEHSKLVRLVHSSLDQLEQHKKHQLEHNSLALEHSSLNRGDGTDRLGLR